MRTGVTSVDDHAITLRRLDASATPIGGDIHVNTYVSGHQTEPSIVTNRADCKRIQVIDSENSSDAPTEAAQGVHFLTPVSSIIDQVSPARRASLGAARKKAKRRRSVRADG